MKYKDGSFFSIVIQATKIVIHILYLLLIRIFVHLNSYSSMKHSLKIMKLPIFLIVGLFGLFLTVASCSSKKDQPATEMTSDSPDAGIVNQDPSASPTIQAVSNEPHFKCPKNCEGGTGDAKANCPVCGTEMVHNQAYHGATTPPDPGSSPASSIKVDPMNTQGAISNTPTTTVTPQTVQPPSAQNAKGEWHFSCAKCDGGAGAAGNCPKCGGPLAHNQAFHQ